MWRLLIRGGYLAIDIFIQLSLIDKVLFRALRSAWNTDVDKELVSYEVVLGRTRQDVCSARTTQDRIFGFCTKCTGGLR